MGTTSPPIVFDEAFGARLRDLLVWRRDVRHFRRDPLPSSALEDLIELACLADVQTHAAKPKTIEEVLQQMEHETGVEGRKAFEGFLKKMAKIKEKQGG
jgi:hypothetical protein